VNKDLSRNRLLEAAQQVENLHPADIAGLLEALDEDEKQKLFSVRTHSAKRIYRQTDQQGSSSKFSD